MWLVSNFKNLLKIQVRFIQDIFGINYFPTSGSCRLPAIGSQNYFNFFNCVQLSL